MPKANYNVKMQFFFDRPEVLKRLNELEVRTLSRIGAYARQATRNSMKAGGKKKQISRPGEAPRWHTRLLKDHIFFAYQESTHSVVIGPRKLNGRSSEGIPKLLNEGGRKLVEERVKKQGRDSRGRFAPSTWVRTGRRVMANYRARPYAGPKAKTWKNIIATWRDITGRSN